MVQYVKENQIDCELWVGKTVSQNEETAWSVQLTDSWTS